MAEPGQHERLVPSLLDRLTDEAPDRKEESRDMRVLSLKKLRESVLRDLAWLFNCTNLGAVTDLTDFPEVAKSVVNFGVPTLAGRSLSSLDASALEQRLKEAIETFEQRILRDGLKVRLALGSGEADRNVAVFEIEGLLWAEPATQPIYLRTEVDLELGQVTVVDTLGSR